MPSSPRRPQGTPRRDFLRVLALAPAAVAAGCATARSGGPASSPAAAAAPAPAPAPDEATGAIRAFPLRADAEPAFVFRAAPARPRE
ncbi:hypothetical protein AnaeK_4037 [Anaeromyxobacter sp. K]|uniref:hypothetical protein n=1 Tax=Anaeromyxobacter sp. (strain K) TaxID=447217 RepID=UPI00015F9407|nr:hypothetical protein [Anaeromyxobacter sp. K]ACG75242.1 hypothetical protein AnaeK_4037 [Anaeromyxobacter sp. K]